MKISTTLHAIKQWDPYLTGRHFKVKTNHQCLKCFLEQSISLEEKKKGVTKIIGYDFEIIYNKGKQNIVENELSRKHERI